MNAVLQIYTVAVYKQIAALNDLFRKQISYNSAKPPECGPPPTLYIYGDSLTLLNHEQPISIAGSYSGYYFRL